MTFTLDSAVDSLSGSAAWMISTATGPGPRLIGVNLDLYDASNVLVQSDGFDGVLAGFASSSFGGAIGPGTYRLVATGTGIRDSSLNIDLRFTGTPLPDPDPTTVPEPATGGLQLAGLALVAARRRRTVQRSADRRTLASSAARRHPASPA